MFVQTEKEHWRGKNWQYSLVIVKRGWFGVLGVWGWILEALPAVSWSSLLQHGPAWGFGSQLRGSSCGLCWAVRHSPCPPDRDQRRLVRRHLDSFECPHKVTISLPLSVVMTQVRWFIPFAYQLTWNAPTGHCLSCSVRCPLHLVTHFSLILLHK